MPDQKRRSVMGVVFLTVFLDMVGFSIIFPLFPSILDHYLAVEGEASLVGDLQRWLQGFADSDWAVIALFGGVLGSLYSFLQFLFAPVWGALSDRHGRRPVLLLTLGGTALSYLVWILAGGFALLVVARLLGGVMAGNLSLASAAIADTHEGKDRAKGMGMMGAGIGLGFVLGPAIGGLTAEWSRGLDWAAYSDLGLNPSRSRWSTGSGPRAASQRRSPRSGVGCRPSARARATRSAPWVTSTGPGCARPAWPTSST